MVTSAKTADSQDRLKEPGTLALVAIQCVLVAGTLSFGVFPLLVDGLVRLAHYDVQSAGLSVTAEMLGQSIGAAAALLLVRRLGSRRVVIAALLFIIVGNGLTVGVYSLFRWLLVSRALAGIGCGLTVVCIGLLAVTRQADRNFAVFNMGTLVGPGLLAAAVPALLHVLKLGGIYAVIAGASALCLCMIPLVPESYRAGQQRRDNASSATVPSVLCMLTCTVTVAYFVSATMFWNYAGDLGAEHHMSVAAVSSAVAQAWLVGGPLGAITAILVVKAPAPHAHHCCSRDRRRSQHVRSYLRLDPGCVRDRPVGLSILLDLIVSHSNGAICVGRHEWATGHACVVCSVNRLRIGPAVGGFVLHVSSYSLLALVCALGYLLFICTAFVLGTVAKQKVNIATGSIAG